MKSNHELTVENGILHEIIEHFPGGVIAYDHNLRLVVCNGKQKALLNYPPELFDFGMPTLEQVIRFNAVRGEYGLGQIEEQVRLRMALAEKREAHRFIRRRPNGMMIEVRGEPLPNGGFVTNYVECRDEAVLEQPTRPREPVRRAMSELEFLEKLEHVVTSPHLRKVSAIHCIEVQTTLQEPSNNSEVHHDVCKAVEMRLLEKLRASDIVARIGSVFAVLQFGIEKPSDTAKLQHRLLEACRCTLTTKTGQIESTVKFGLAMFPRDGTNAVALLNKARQNLV